MSLLRVLALVGTFLFLLAGASAAEPLPLLAPVGGARTYQVAAEPGAAVPDSHRPALGSRDSAEDPRRLTVRVTPGMWWYSRIRYCLSFLSVAVALGALFLILSRGWSARLRDWAAGLSSQRYVQALAFYPAHYLLYTGLTLWFGFLSSFALPHLFGLSNQTLGGWCLDRLKTFGLHLLLGPPILAFLSWLLRRSPGRWWAWCWLASIPVSVFGVLVAPVLVDPIYNRYTPLPDTPFRARILELAHSAGIRESAVFQVEMSHRTKSVNAYVTGLGGTARIVLWDTLLLRLSEEEALAVMAHEMGHYVERHVPIGLAGAVAGTLVLLLILDRLARAALHRWRNRWRVEGLDDLAMYPLYLALVIGLNFAASPVTCALSRVLESRADEFALRQTADPRDVASALVKLSENNLSDPRPPAFVEFWLFTHPPLQARIDRALTPR